MKIFAVCFTCADDWESAQRAAAALPEGWRVIFVVPKAEMLFFQNFGVSDFRFLDFTRGGNLNGFACIDGMVGVYEDLVASGAGVIVKFDSDVRITSPEAFVPAQDEDAVVMRARAGGVKFFGAAYAFRAALVPVMRTAVEAARARAWESGDRLGEDVFFSRCLHEARARRRYLEPGALLWCNDPVYGGGAESMRLGDAPVVAEHWKGGIPDELV